MLPTSTPKDIVIENRSFFRQWKVRVGATDKICFIYCYFRKIIVLFFSFFTEWAHGSVHSSAIRQTRHFGGFKPQLAIRGRSASKWRITRRINGFQYSNLMFKCTNIGNGLYTIYIIIDTYYQSKYWWCFCQRNFAINSNWMVPFFAKKKAQKWWKVFVDMDKLCWI